MKGEGEGEGKGGYKGREELSVLFLIQGKMKLTHRVQVIKNLVDPDYLIIELIIGGWTGKECVSIGNKQVEDDNHLHRTK